MYRDGTAHVERVFNRQTVDISGTVVSDKWYKMPEHFIAHGVNGVIAGSGTLTLSYSVAAVPDNDFGVSQGNILSGATAAANSPFLRSMTVRPSVYVQFTLTETGGANSLLVTMYFVQTGRGA